MKFFDKLRKIGKKGKALVCCALATVTTAAMAVCACAAETDVSGSDTLDMATVMQNAGDSLVANFNSLIQTLIPVVLGILGGGLVIFGLMALIRLGKKVFTKVAS